MGCRENSISPCSVSEMQMGMPCFICVYCEFHIDLSRIQEEIHYN